MGKNILEVCLSPDLGGLELFSVHCYDSFKTKGVCKIALAFEKKLDKYLACDDKIYVERNKFFPFVPAFELAKRIDENEIDVVHFHWTRDIATVVLAKLISKRKPQIVQSRHMDMTRFKDDFYHRWLYENVSKIHAVTRQVKEQLIKYIPNSVRPDVELVYLGVKSKKELDLSEIRKKHDIKDGEFVVGIVGRIEEGKGQSIVIEAISKLKSSNVKLLIVGDGMGDDYLDKLHDSSAKYEIEKRVIFTGFTKEVDAYMQMCDVTVLATKNETFGLVVIESMANSTPVIATNRGGPLEIIDDMVDGLLYDGGVDDLAKKIELLLHDEDLKSELSLNSLRKVQDKFDFNKQMEKLYEMITRDSHEVEV